MNLTEAVETLVTAEIYNRHESLDEDDLPPNVRETLWSRGEGGVERPTKVSEDLLDLQDEEELKELPFVDYDGLEGTYLLTVLDLGLDWLISHDGDSIETNPAIAYQVEGEEGYEEARERNPPKEASREWIESMVHRLSEDEEEAEEMLNLVKIVPPDEVIQSLDELVLTGDQREEIGKVAKAIENRSYLRNIGLREIGKLLFVGPPGTGKTSTAMALGEELSLPVLDVRLSMITSRYLGETSKNIDRVFELAKRLSPCILFIDEFDFVAKTRTSDEHAALKRAVNTLLKSIDDISLVHDGVVLIGATNHPKLLDQAAWRRFDEIVHFPKPDEETRKLILENVLERIEGDIDTGRLASLTDGFSGSDLRLIVREAVLDALVEGRTGLEQEDLESAVNSFNDREETLQEVVEEMER